MAGLVNQSDTNPRRAVMLMTAVLALLILVTWWSYSQLNSAYARATEDGNAWAQSKGLAEQIQALRSQPTLADDQGIQKDDMTQRVANAVAAASLNEDRLIAIEHQTTRRIGRTAYLEEPTRLTFKDTSLRQVITALDALTSHDPRLHVSYLRLTAPRQNTDPMLWGIDATVTYLIYEPIQNNH